MDDKNFEQRKDVMENTKKNLNTTSLKSYR